jgi:beta-glucosidase
MRRFPAHGAREREGPEQDARRPVIPANVAARALPPLVLLAALVPSLARPQTCPGPRLRASAGPPSATPWTDPSLPAESRTELLLSAMTLEEKIDLATGERCLVYGYYNAANDRLGIPALTMTDGPAGIRIPYRRVNGGRATQLPAPIALAASWDLSLAAAHGDVLGAEALATGHNVMLGPTLDVARHPLAGRTFEGLGEDPLLVSRFAVPLVQGIQRHPVLASAKHWAVYGREDERFTLDARLDERALREIYLRPFEAAVRQAGVATVMCGFNRVNGVYACEDPDLLNGILKGEMGFDGFVLSDWGAIHDTADAALGGLDQELAFEKYFGARLLDAVRRGEVPAEVVDEKARRILRAMFRGGLFDRRVRVEPLPVEAHGARAREIAEGGAVLLKNADLLPLGADALGSIAVIGADAANASAQGGGAARVEPTYTVSPLEAIRRRAGERVRVEHAEGTDPVVPADLLPGPPSVPSSVLSPPGDPGARGLHVEYWNNPRFEGEPGTVRTERRVAASAGFFSYQSVHAASVPEVPSRYALTRFSARWTGTLTAPATGEYTFTLTSRGRGWVYLDGAPIIDHSDEHDLALRSAKVRLVAGERHDLRVDYSASSPAIGVAVDLGGDVRLGWEPPAGAVMPAAREAADLAAASDVAVVVVRDYGTEERDRRELALPNGQDALVRAVAAANPRTIVVLTTGQPSSMPWLADVPAVLQAWYGGQEQGSAIAAVLFGDVNPSGKLPITFPRALEQTPDGAAPPADGAVAHAEGVFVGYRWYDAHGLEPLFPFGFGLSYTSFRYDDLEVEAGPTAGGAESRAHVAFTVTNTGARAGSEVAQVYVGSCLGDAAPPRQLAGFSKVHLAPGESARVRVELGAEPLSHWSPDAGAWRTPACTVPLVVASSSRDVRLAGGLRVSADGAVAAASPSDGGGCGHGPAGAAASLLAVAAAWLLGRRLGPAGARRARRPGGAAAGPNGSFDAAPPPR